MLPEMVKFLNKNDKNLYFGLVIFAIKSMYLF